VIAALNLSGIACSTGAACYLWARSSRAARTFLGTPIWPLPPEDRRRRRLRPQSQPVDQRTDEEIDFGLVEMNSPVLAAAP